MGAPKRYNGHHCWNCWNVALWISNDEGLYNLALEILRSRKHCENGGKPRTPREAAYILQGMLPAATPDGAKYGIKALESALKGLVE